MLALSFKIEKCHLISKGNTADITTGCHNAALSSEKTEFSRTLLEMFAFFNISIESISMFTTDADCSVS